MKRVFAILTYLIVVTVSALSFKQLSPENKKENILEITLKGNRFITLNTVVRVNQIEITRNTNAGEDEST